MNATGPRIALTTYSVKPRGGVVHTLELAEALVALGVDVTVVAMGDPDNGFFREVAAPIHIIAAPPWQDTLEARVFSWIDAMEEGLAAIAMDFDILHAQDCISARAANRVRTDPAQFTTFRTVHHVDDFTTQALIDCQAAAITEPDKVLVVSDLWRRRLLDDPGVEATVISNGVRCDRFAPRNSDPTVTTALRRSVRASGDGKDRHLFLTVGGIEPRKGSKYLIEALSAIKGSCPTGATPILAVIGGHSFQDYTPYRQAVLESLDDLDLELGVDVILLGTVDDQELPAWFHAADSFVFPSLNEGWGLVVLEAQAAGLPIVTSDIEVFKEFLVPNVSAVFTEAANSQSLAAGMQRVMSDTDLAVRLSDAGPAAAARYSWPASAAVHIDLYNNFYLHGSRTTAQRPSNCHT